MDHKHFDNQPLQKIDAILQQEVIFAAILHQEAGEPCFFNEINRYQRGGKWLSCCNSANVQNRHPYFDMPYFAAFRMSVDW